MEIILVKTSTCGKCKNFQPIFEEYCKTNNIKYRIICYDTAPEEDKKLVMDMGLSAVPAMIFIENDFKQAYSGIYSADGITSARNEFLASKGV